ncbi:hypothetical protein BGX27_001757 [Mortierella sp. AM989]|nr:hypothetical protein BGX27_001757 [Mortierella sp. AM989]
MFTLDWTMLSLDEGDSANLDDATEKANFQTQFHHYIPRFILKTFSEDYEEAKQQTLIAPKQNKKKGRQKAAPIQSYQSTVVLIVRPMRRRDFEIKIYRVLKQDITLESISRAYGNQDMYRDINLEDCMLFEKLLSKLEDSSAVFIQKILSGQDISLTRTKLVEFKRFLAIMMYRDEHRRDQYFNDLFDNRTRHTIRKHMRFNNIDSIREVWFENLKWILKSSAEEIGKEALKIYADSDFDKAVEEYKGPIHAYELLEYYHMTTNYVCVWEAQEGSEFIMSDNGFGCFEGDKGFFFHTFYIVSPKYAIVLANRGYMSDLFKEFPFRKSWFEEFHPFPETVYKNKKMESPKDFTPDDVFKYRRVLIPRKKVWLVNSIFLDERRKYISHRSNASMFKTLKFYDKNKDKMFIHKHDYSILKRQLFDEMNRTHST